MTASVLLLLTAEPDAASRLADWLISAGHTGGWHESTIDLVGGPAPYLSRREQVRGRRRRVRFELHVDRHEAVRIARALSETFGHDGCVVMRAVDTFPLVAE